MLLRSLQAGHSSLRQRRIELDAEPLCCYARSRRAILHRLRRLCCSDSQIDPLKSRIAAATRLFPGILCSDCQIHPLKSRITAATEPKRGQFLHRFPSLPPEIQNHCSPGVVAFCRRNHSPSRQRRLESDAENRCCGRDRHHSDGFYLGLCRLRGDLSLPASATTFRRRAILCCLKVN